ncbi:TPA: hypothetical protein N0F65_002103 [Lagenidium giganteum]|uniref:BD-FAE-like domain-containing protein n=1 Tax=Lagenidium giganteum TaxID=4803 RepID=A0AAV2ZDJ4_9STRA|nr:TPA: hypothetical protein N0F65_002103 [Lagenidium giganteum]
MLLRTLMHTLAAQLASVAECFICFIKPTIAARVVRLLVWKDHQAKADLAYGDHPRHRMDLYGVQTDSKQPPRPVLVFVHGGAWAFGHKWQYGLVGEFLSKHGLLVAMINYRTFPAGTVLDMVQDVEDAEHTCALALARAVRFDDANEPEARSITWTVGADSEVASDMRSQIRAFIGMSGPYDIEEQYLFEIERGIYQISPLKPANQGKQCFRQHSPTTIVAHAAAAAAGNTDLQLMGPAVFTSKWDLMQAVPRSSSLKFVDALRQAQVYAEFLKIEKCTHEDVLFVLMAEANHVHDEFLALIHRVIQSETEGSTNW